MIAGGGRIWPERGYWNRGELSGFVARCEPLLGCVGGQFSECAPGYEAAYCAECSRGYAYFLTLPLAARGYLHRGGLQVL